MKILGFTWNEFLIASMFATTLVLFIELPISQTNDSTLGESIFGHSEHRRERSSCPELKEEIEKIGKDKFKREILSLHKTKGRTNFEETRQLFLNNVLTESLNGEPAYYNSNILSRYFRKDYYGDG